MQSSNTMGAKGRANASDAIDHLRKHFTCEAKGSAYGAKHGNVVNNSVKAILAQIKKLHDPKEKVLESVYLRLHIHDSATVIDYGQILPVMNKITQGLREHLPKACSINYATAGHHNSGQIKFEYEGFLIEKELWQ